MAVCSRRPTLLTMAYYCLKCGVHESMCGCEEPDLIEEDDYDEKEDFYYRYLNEDEYDDDNDYPDDQDYDDDF